MGEGINSSIFLTREKQPLKATRHLLRENGLEKKRFPR